MASHLNVCRRRETLFVGLEDHNRANIVNDRHGQFGCHTERDDAVTVFGGISRPKGILTSSKKGLLLLCLMSLVFVLPNMAGRAIIYRQILMIRRVQTVPVLKLCSVHHKQYILLAIRIYPMTGGNRLTHFYWFGL